MSLDVKGITFRYKGAEKNVLQDVTLSFPADRIVAVTGRNGCGKTTLARVITGILKPESGSIFVDGKDISDYSLAERGSLIGYVMQNPERQIFSSTVEEEMRYGLKNLGLPEEEIEERTDYFLRHFGMEHHRKDFPFVLSHGEKQRLVLAAILAMKPAYLILDEPTASLDYKRKKQLGEYLQNLQCGVIVISHDEEFNRTYCQDSIRLGEHLKKQSPMEQGNADAAQTGIKQEVPDA